MQLQAPVNAPAIAVPLRLTRFAFLSRHSQKPVDKPHPGGKLPRNAAGDPGTLDHGFIPMEA
jgi:hypothetical protein